MTTAIYDEILRLLDVLQVDVDNEARNNNMHESFAVPSFDPAVSRCR